MHTFSAPESYATRLSSVGLCGCENKMQPFNLRTLLSQSYPTTIYTVIKGYPSTGVEAKIQLDFV